MLCPFQADYRPLKPTEWWYDEEIHGDKYRVRYAIRAALPGHGREVTNILGKQRMEARRQEALAEDDDTSSAEEARRRKPQKIHERQQNDEQESSAKKGKGKGKKRKGEPLASFSSSTARAHQPPRWDAGASSSSAAGATWDGSSWTPAMHSWSYTGQWSSQSWTTPWTNSGWSSR